MIKFPNFEKISLGYMGNTPELSYIRRLLPNRLEDFLLGRVAFSEEMIK